MRESHPFEKGLGMEFYSTECDGVGGKLKTRFEDFIVEEILPNQTALRYRDWSEVPANSSHISGEHNRFVSFTLQKMGISTMTISTILASSLGLPRNLVTYAGLKDKRAITVQRMSAPSRVAHELVNLGLSNIEVRDFEYTRHPIQIGDLWGNQFTIVLRDLDAITDNVSSIIDAIRTTPILNYFGVQRFGLSRPGTHIAGKFLIKRDFENVVRTALCTPGDFESEELLSAREMLSEELAPTESIIDVFPKDLNYERAIMNELLKHPGDFKRAALKIEPRVLTLMVHAYQSYLFNRVLSERARIGMSIIEPEPGDFIIALDTPHSGRDQWLFVTESSLDERRDQVRAQEFGLALPVPGYATRIPPTRQSELLKDILDEEGISLLSFRNSELKALDSPGGLHLTAIQVPDLSASTIPDGLKVHFKLRKGSYATIVMRELMKNHPLHRI